MRMIKVKSRAQARQVAIDWQQWASTQDLSYYELARWQGYFIALAKKYRLAKEYRENGIL